LIQGCNIFTLFIKNRVDIGEKQSVLTAFLIMRPEQVEPHTLNL
jgi:hypothetical protein